MDALAQIARTLLYEGYVLWPYRRSAIKNRQRWTFGGVYPRAHAEVSGGADRACVRTECLLDASRDARVTVSVRFLQVVARQVMSCDKSLDMPMSELTVSGQRYLSWDEATERTVDAVVTLRDDRVRAVLPIGIDGGRAREPLVDGRLEMGAIVRSWEQLTGTIVINAQRLSTADASHVYRVGVSVTNDSTWGGAERELAVRHTLVSTHIVLRATGGEFISQLDPPVHLESESRANHNDGLWPVLVGADGVRDTMLASPIILYDYPRLAPESPGDLFDGGEIDQLLILNILALSVEEQREMRDSDPRAREILERCKSLSDEELERLHGTVRALRPFTAAGGANA